MFLNKKNIFPVVDTLQTSYMLVSPPPSYKQHRDQLTTSPLVVKSYSGLL